MKYGMAFPECHKGSDFEILRAVDKFAYPNEDSTPAYPHMVPVWATLDPQYEDIPRYGYPSDELFDDFVQRDITPVVYVETAPNRARYEALEHQPIAPLRPTQFAFIARIDHEMNAKWPPWATNPEQYKRRFRKVVRAYREAAPNVAIHWCAQGMGLRNLAAMEEWYPGDEWVDFAGFDKYDLGGRVALPKAWQKPIKTIRQFTDKQIIVGEYGSLRFDPDEWIASPRDRWLDSVNFVEDVFASIYFNIDMAEMGNPKDKRNWTMNRRMLSFYRGYIYTER